MRWLLLFCLVTSCAVAGETRSTESKEVSPGHSVFGEQPRIQVLVRFISRPPEDLGKDVRPRVAIPDRQLTLPGFSADTPGARDGITLISARTVVEQQTPLYLQIISDAETRPMLEKAQSGRQSNVRFAPKVIVRAGEEAELADVSRHSFPASNAQASAPQKVTMEEGIRLRLRPDILDDGQIRLAMAVRFSSIDSTTLPEDPVDETLGLIPPVHVSAIRLTADLRETHTLVIGGFSYDRTNHGSRTKRNWFGVWNAPGSDSPERESMLLLLTPVLLSDDEQESGTQAGSEAVSAGSRPAVRGQSPSVTEQ